MSDSTSLTLTFNSCLNSCKEAQTFLQGRKHVLIFRKESKDVLQYLLKKLYDREFLNYTQVCDSNIYTLLLEVFKTEDYFVNVLLSNNKMILDQDMFKTLNEDQSTEKVIILKKYVLSVFNAANGAFRLFNHDYFAKPIPENIDERFISSFSLSQANSLGELFLYTLVKEGLDKLDLCLQIKNSFDNGGKIIPHYKKAK